MKKETYTTPVVVHLRVEPLNLLNTSSIEDAELYGDAVGYTEG